MVHSIQPSDTFDAAMASPLLTQKAAHLNDLHRKIPSILDLIALGLRSELGTPALDPTEPRDSEKTGQTSIWDGAMLT